MRPRDPRFETDEFPDQTWGICMIHNPSGIVRLVDEYGNPTPNAMCQHCWEESQSEAFFSCPEHGIQRKTPGGGCPVPGCLGKSSGPTQDEIEREAESLSRVWPGGAPRIEDAVVPPVPGSQDQRRDPPGEGAQGEAGEVPRPDRGRVEAEREERGRVLTPPKPEDKYLIQSDPAWKDPFLDP